jgi:hypothetical protein
LVDFGSVSVIHDYLVAAWDHHILLFVVNAYFSKSV